MSKGYFCNLIEQVSLSDSLKQNNVTVRISNNDTSHCMISAHPFSSSIRFKNKQKYTEKKKKNHKA